MYSNRVMAAFLILGVITCGAQTRLEEEPLCDQQGAKRVKITDDDAAVLGFAIGHASLEDVQGKLGSATTERVSREEESDIAICYVSPADGTVLVFYSGAMGGWKDITWFALWSGKAAFANASRCTASAQVSWNLTTPSGLRLGLKQRQLNRIAGTPTKVSASSARYDYLCRQKMSQEEITRFETDNNWDATSDPYFDRMSWIHVYFKHTAATRIEIGMIVSY
jgi:hypothetical protein